jgi:sugar O-acyltransferase (sialic acid O-acetyltransferase NeuD family)
MKALVLCGAGGHAKVVVDVLRAAGDHTTLVFVDANAGAIGSTVLGYRVYPLEAIEELHTNGCDSFLMCIGDNLARSSYYDSFVRLGLQPVTAVHPSAVVSPSAIMGPGTVVMARAVINASARIGANCIINTGAIVEHDCVIGDHVHLSPGATLGGAVTLESLVHVGLNASVLPGVSVGRASVVGAGAVVVRCIPESIVVAGVPARILKSLS